MDNVKSIVVIVTTIIQNVPFCICELLMSYNFKDSMIKMCLFLILTVDKLKRLPPKL